VFPLTLNGNTSDSKLTFPLGLCVIALRVIPKEIANTRLQPSKSQSSCPKRRSHSLALLMCPQLEGPTQDSNLRSHNHLLHQDPIHLHLHLAHQRVHLTLHLNGNHTVTQPKCTKITTITSNIMNPNIQPSKVQITIYRVIWSSRCCCFCEHGHTKCMVVRMIHDPKIFHNAPKILSISFVIPFICN